MWRTGWKIFTRHPIIGNGINMFFGEFKELRDDEYKGRYGSYAHNGYLQIAAETGVIGLAVFLLIVGKVLYAGLGGSRYFNEENPHRKASLRTGSVSAEAVRFRRSLALGLAGGLFAFLIHSFFDTNLQSLPLVILFWFGAALLMSLESIYARKI